MYYSTGEGHNELSFRNTDEELERASVRIETEYLSDYQRFAIAQNAIQRCDGTGVNGGPSGEDDDYNVCPGCFACREEVGGEDLIEYCRRAA